MARIGLVTFERARRMKAPGGDTVLPLLPQAGNQIHDRYSRLLDELTGDLRGTARVSHEVLGYVLYELAVAAPGGLTRAQFTEERPASPRSGGPISHATLSKATAVLEQAGLTSRRPLPQTGRQGRRSGRRIEPLHLGSPRWAMVGVRITTNPPELVVVLTGLDAELIKAPKPRRLHDVANWEQVIDEIALLVTDLRKHWQDEAPDQQRRLLGLGIEVAGHVHDGSVLRSDHPGFGQAWRGAPLAQRLSDRLNIPVVLDNDANLMAVHERYRPRAHHMPENSAIVAVLDDGIGAGLSINGIVYRGGRGMAGEIGHIPVMGLETTRFVHKPAVNIKAEDPPRTSLDVTSSRTFDDPCDCGKPGHVDCLATPRRLVGESTGEGFTSSRFSALARQPSDHAGIATREGETFWRGGAALGLGLVSLVDLVNPAWLLLQLPPALAKAEPGDGTAAGAYRLAIESVLDCHAFSTAATDARHGQQRLSVESLDPKTVAQEAARNAAIRVLDEFISHSRGQDTCSSNSYVPERQGNDMLAGLELLHQPRRPVRTQIKEHNRRLREEIEQISAQVLNLISSCDPEGLLEADAPADEYQAEVSDLVRLIRSGEVSESSVMDVWCRWFGPNNALNSDPDSSTLETIVVGLRGLASAQDPGLDVTA